MHLALVAKFGDFVDNLAIQIIMACPGKYLVQAFCRRVAESSMQLA
jgi:hypothetical protein